MVQQKFSNTALFTTFSQSNFHRIFNKLLHMSKPILKPVLPPFIREWVHLLSKALRSSSPPEKRFPFRLIFTYGNSSKSHGARSRLWGGWPNIRCRLWHGELEHYHGEKLSHVHSWLWSQVFQGLNCYLTWAVVYFL